jgi:hypothetical protein
MAIRPSVVYFDPWTLLDAASMEIGRILPEYLFNDSQYQKLQEAWCAGMFGCGYATRIDAACKVAVNFSTQGMDADFFLMTGNREWSFQLAEVQRAGRKRGSEYKQLASGERRTVGYDPDRGAVECADCLANAVHKKKAKRYAGSAQLNLLLYGNFNSEARHDQLVAQLGLFSNDFASLWIVTSDSLCSIFSVNGPPPIPGWWKFRERRVGG